MRVGCRGLLSIGFALAYGLALGQLPADVRAAQMRAQDRLVATFPDVRFFAPGKHIERVFGRPFGGGVTPEHAFQAFLLQYSGLFAMGDGELVPDGTQDVGNGRFTAGYFQMHVDGVPVDRGWVTLLAKNELGNPIVLASANTHVVRSGLGRPRVPAQRAVRLLKRHHPSLKTFSEPTLCVWMDEEVPRLAWTFYGENPELVEQEHEHGGQHGPLPERVKAFVDAITGRILEERNEVYPIDVIGNVKGWATPGLKPDQANNPETLQPLELLRVSITGGNNGLTNAAGDYLIPHPGTSPVTVNASLQGPWVTVSNLAGSNLTLSQSVTPPGPANFIFNTGLAEFDTAQVNAFIQTNRVHNFAKAINPSYPGIDIAISATVNRDATCNAFYSNNSINFYRAGGGCPNTAYSTVVWHEYGHFIIAKGHPSATGDYHEGMADVTANLLGDTPWLGEDFRGPNTGPLRSAYNNVVYPCSGEVHLCGQVLSGAFWLTLDELNLTVGHATGLQLVREWYLNSILLRPPSVNPGITIDVLTLDDDDGNLNNGTPHYDEIAAGFGAKRLYAPAIQWLAFNPIRVPAELVPSSPNEVFVLFRMQVLDNVGQLDPASVKLHHRVNSGTWQEQRLSLYADPGLFIGALLQPQCGAEVDWYVSAKDTAGHSMFYPAGGPLAPANFLVADGLVTIMEDTFEANLGWSVVNENLTSGAWVRANPNGTFLNGQPANPEDDSNDPGTFCFFTGQGTPGGSAGEADVDGGPTRLSSPQLNLSGFDAIIEYRRWFFNDDGDDALVVEISNNNGATWTVVESVMGIQNSWVQRRFRVGRYVTPSSQVRVRFSVADNPNNSVTEAALDYFVVKRIVCN